MDELRPEAKGWWARYRKWVFAAILFYLALMGLLLLFSAGPDKTPFVYQIF